MTQQQIPAAAVEAAHRAWREQAATEGSIFEYNLRAALQAAAPELMAKAWDAALEDADDEGYLYAHQTDALKARNPYKE